MRLTVQAGVDDMDVIFVGCLPIEVDPEKQEVRPMIRRMQ